jgi:hypothetical protein
MSGHPKNSETAYGYPRNFTMLKALIVHIYVYNLLLIRPIISYFFAAKLV